MQEIFTKSRVKRCVLTKKCIFCSFCTFLSQNNAVLAKIMADLAKKKAEKCKKYAVFSKKWRKYLQIWLFCCTFAAEISMKRQK